MLPQTPTIQTPAPAHIESNDDIGPPMADHLHHHLCFSLSPPHRHHLYHVQRLCWPIRILSLAAPMSMMLPHKGKQNNDDMRSSKKRRSTKDTPDRRGIEDLMRTACMLVLGRLWSDCTQLCIFLSLTNGVVKAWVAQKLFKCNLWTVFTMSKSCDRKPITPKVILSANQSLKQLKCHINPPPQLSIRSFYLKCFLSVWYVIPILLVGAIIFTSWPFSMIWQWY